MFIQTWEFLYGYILIFFISIWIPLSVSSQPVLLGCNNLTASQLIVKQQRLEEERKKKKTESSTNHAYNALHLEKNIETPLLGVTLRVTISLLCINSIKYNLGIMFSPDTQLNVLEIFLKGGEAWPRFAKILKQNGLRV